MNRKNLLQLQARISGAFVAVYAASALAFFLWLAAYAPLIATGIIIGLLMGLGYELLYQIHAQNKARRDIHDVTRRYK